MTPASSSDAGGSWYATAVTAAAVAVLTLLAGAHRPVTRLAALPLAATAVIAAVEGIGRRRGASPSPAAVVMVGVLAVGAALLCLLGLASGSQ